MAGGRIAGLSFALAAVYWCGAGWKPANCLTSSLQSPFVGGNLRLRTGMKVGAAACTQRVLRREALVMASGQGFGAPRRTLKLEYGGSSIEKEEQVAKWEGQYKAFIKRMGKYLTAMSWEGHRRHGRGAIYANNQARPPVERGMPATKANNFAGAPTMYVPMDKYKERDPKSEEEKKDMEQIMQRIQGYDPEREFVVIFEAAGLMGADVVKPSVGPPEMHKLINPEEYGMSEEDKEDDSRVLAEYWTGGGAARPADGQDYIDMSSLIANAQTAESGVIDIDFGEISDSDKDEGKGKKK